MSHASDGPEIAQELCQQCGACVGACSHGSLHITESGLEIVHPEECDDCGACEDACPEGAISCGFQIVWQDPSAGTSPPSGSAGRETDGTADGGRDG